MTLHREAPTGYTLRVAGRLDARWVAWFDGFTVTGDADGTTTLRGTVADQAQLHQLLAKVRDLGLALVSLEATSVIRGSDSEGVISGGEPRPVRG